MNVIYDCFFFFFCFVSGTFKVKAGMAQMAKGGIIMDVTNAEEAHIAEEAGVTLFYTKFYFCCLYCKYFI